MEEPFVVLQGLGTPFTDSVTGEQLKSIKVQAGDCISLGRSKKACKYFLSDTRVSRVHCTLRLDPASRELALYDGSISKVSCQQAQLKLSLDSNSPPASPSTNERFQGPEHTKSARFGKKTAPTTSKPSLNGTYVNGHHIREAKPVILRDGAEVSLVACTRNGKLLDTSFKARLAFKVEFQAQPSATMAKTQLGTALRTAQVATSESPELVQASRNLDSQEQKSKGLLGNPKHSQSERAQELVVKDRGDFKLLVKQNEKQSASQGQGSVRKEKFNDPKETAWAADDKSTGLEAVAAERKHPSQEKAKSCSTRSAHEQLDHVEPAPAQSAKDHMRKTGLITDDSACHVATLAALNAKALDRKLSVRLRAQVPSGGGIVLNKLAPLGPDDEGNEGAVSLADLLAPVEDLRAVFAATFGCDYEWFLTEHQLPTHLPVTIATHDREKSWSPDLKSRSEKPDLENWPNLTLLYPPFPDSSRFGPPRKPHDKTEPRTGIGCHHPKLFLLQRKDSLRAVISSANLTKRQWHHTTNTVWWQDFPFHTPPSPPNLITPPPYTSDFLPELAAFVASLVADSPEHSSWVTLLSNYDFSSANAALIASVPGIHSLPPPNLPPCITPLAGVLSSVTSTKSTPPLSPAALASRLSSRKRKSSEKTPPPSRPPLRVVTNSQELDSEHCRTPSPKLKPREVGIVATSIAGVYHRFGPIGDPVGVHTGTLASALGTLKNRSACGVARGACKDCWSLGSCHLATVWLQRARTIKADKNAVGVVLPIPSEEAQGADVMAEVSSQSSESEKQAGLRLGFLPRAIAAWIAPLWDRGVLAFVARVPRRELLEAAHQQGDGGVPLFLHVFEVLKTHPWPDSEETAFFYGSSSVGTSLDAPFLAALAAAAGRRSASEPHHSESDSEWGCWTARHEAADPSIGLVFPTLHRACTGVEGPLAHHGCLCFAESTWERLQSSRILHDAVPHPPGRIGFPMHSKVCIRQFLTRDGKPYGWVYAGSHNFSPAAWGRPLQAKPEIWQDSRRPSGTVMGTALQIHNYELGVLFLAPRNQHLNFDLQRVMLPYEIPPPRYRLGDRPATGKALREWRKEALLAEALLLKDTEGANVDHEDEEEVDVGVVDDRDVAQVETQREEEEYAAALWTEEVDGSEERVALSPC